MGITMRTQGSHAVAATKLLALDRYCSCPETASVRWLELACDEASAASFQLSVVTYTFDTVLLFADDNCSCSSRQMSWNLLWLV